MVHLSSDILSRDLRNSVGGFQYGIGDIKTLEHAIGFNEKI